MRADARTPLSVSVALCTRNGAEFLGEQLDSILNQTMPPAQLVLSDDDSTDGTFDPEGVAVLKKSFIDMGLLKEIPNDKDMFTTQFLPVKVGAQ